MSTQLISTGIVNTDMAVEKHKKILVVDDNPINLQLVRSLLAEQNYSVTIAINGEIALKLARANPPDLILLDINMPGMDGYEVCQELKADMNLCNIPVIFLSALKDGSGVVRAFNSGGIDYITKPFKQEILIARVNTHITVSRLQYDLKNLTASLEHKVAERTNRLQKSNEYLKTEIYERTKTEQQLIESQNRLNYALTSSNEGIWDWNLTSNESVFNDTFFSMLGYDPSITLNSYRAWFDLIHADDISDVEESFDHCFNNENHMMNTEYRIKTSSGAYIWMVVRGKVVEYDEDQAVRACGTNTDINNLKLTEHKLSHLASYDNLTNLPNRRMFFDLTKDAIAAANRNQSRLAVVFIDLDRFKNINDYLGHHVGDSILKGVALRLKEVVRSEDVVCRLGGDEFTVLMREIQTPYDAELLAERILGAHKSSFTLDGHEITISLSIGIVLFPENALTAETLLKKADAAMYLAKNLEGQSARFYTDEMQLKIDKRVKQESLVRDALANDYFTAFYQPKVSCEAHYFNSVEALCRLCMPSNQIIPPSEFIDIAEETGLITALGDKILEISMRDTKQLIDRDLFNGKVAVNISARQFSQKDFLYKLDKIIEETNFPTQCLELELTEATVVQNFRESINIMSKIKDRNISLALDDFGTGYSSLNYLKKFPIDVLKIDRSFIQDIEIGVKDKNIVKAIIDLSHVLGLKVVAEGVETIKQADILQDIDCDILQGFLFSKPLPKDKLFEYILEEKGKK